MNLKTWMLISTVVAAVFGVLFVIVPGPVTGREGLLPLRQGMPGRLAAHIPAAAVLGRITRRP